MTGRNARAGTGNRPSYAFIALAALAGVALRFVLADEVFFRLLQPPSHDMSQGIGFFATSMHSVRLGGDLAWWYPGSFTGYAQFYQAFFGPLAPTYGHIVFIAWSHLVAILGTLGIAMPEYFQYLVVNYVVLPYLAFAAFGYFCAQFLRRREAVAMAMLVYVLSGIGLWNSAWFFFQEAFSVFFLLGASLAVLKRPTPARMLVWLAAALIQLASLNYWTVYNIFFVAIVLASYAATHWNQCVRLAARVRALFAAAPRPALAVSLAALCVVLAWGVLIASALSSQSGKQVRYIYTAQQAVERIQDMREFTTELFNPLLERAVSQYRVISAMHNARYLGVLLLPFIAIALFARTTRRTRWMMLTAVLLLAVCMGNPLFVLAWVEIPMMDRIQHVFYFYSHYWQTVVLLLAAIGMDLVASPIRSASTASVGRWSFAVTAAVCAGVLAETAIATNAFANRDLNLEAILHATLLLGMGSIVFWSALRTGRARDLRFAVAMTFALLFVDLSLYFHTATRADMRMTAERWASRPFTAEQRAALASAWGTPRPQAGFAAGTHQFMPMRNDFWPTNHFMIPGDLDPGIENEYERYIVAAEPVVFYDGAQALPPGRTMPAMAVGDLAPFDEALRVAGAPAEATSATSRRVASGFSYRWRHWAYNGFELEATAPRPGWLMVRQLHDADWRVTIDGRAITPLKANFMNMAVPLEAGSHVLRWEYQPLPRRLYWPSAALLEFVVALFLLLAWRLPAANAPGRPRPAARARPSSPPPPRA